MPGWLEVKMWSRQAQGGNAPGGFLWFGPHVRVGRFRCNFRVMKHVYPGGADRWVVQTCAYYDRKSKSTWQGRRNG